MGVRPPDPFCQGPQAKHAPSADIWGQGRSGNGTEVHIAMHDALLVNMCEAFGDLDGDGVHERRRHLVWLQPRPSPSRMDTETMSNAIAVCGCNPEARPFPAQAAHHHPRTVHNTKTAANGPSETSNMVAPSAKRAPNGPEHANMPLRGTRVAQRISC